MKDVGIVPQWSYFYLFYEAQFLLDNKCCGDCSPVKSVFIFYSSIRFNCCWLINVVGIVPQWSSVYFFPLAYGSIIAGS